MFIFLKMLLKYLQYVHKEIKYSSAKYQKYKPKAQFKTLIKSPPRHNILTAFSSRKAFVNAEPALSLNI